MSSWDDAETAVHYEAFCRRHSRYQRANAALIGHASIAGGMRLLDFAAGTGRTAEAALRRLDEDGRVMCIEPFAGMRSEGMRRITDSRVTWTTRLPDAKESFDRILCGAAIWQFQPLAETFRVLARLLRPHGALCFNIPAAYLQEAEEPGGGTDPSLLSLPALLMASCACAPALNPPDEQVPVPLSGAGVDEWLTLAGLRAESWCFRMRVTQEAYADWLKIPVLTDRLLPGMTPQERVWHIDSALSRVDRSSWKWERWRGWTAWNL